MKNNSVDKNTAQIHLSYLSLQTMSDTFSYLQSLRNMCLHDPIVQQLYDGELNWCDIPDDDEPLELDDWKSYQSPKKMLNVWKKDTRQHLFPLPSKSIGIQTESKITIDSETQTESDELGLCIALFIHSILNYTPPITITHHLIEVNNSDLEPKKSSIHLTPKIASEIKASNVPKTLFLKSLPTDLTENELKEIFKVYGAIREISIKRVMDPNDKTKVLLCKFAHIRFQTSESAKKAYNKLNHNLLIRKKKIGIEFAKDDW